MPLDVSLLKMFIYLFLVGSAGSLLIPKVSLVAQRVKNLPAMQETQVQSLGQEDPLEKGWLPTSVFLPEEFHRGAWWATRPRVAESQKWMTNTFTHQVFSSCSKLGLLSSCSPQASYWGGFFCCWVQALELRLGSSGVPTQLPCSTWCLGPGIQSMSPALTDRLPTTGPPGKPWCAASPEFSLLLY